MVPNKMFVTVFLVHYFPRSVIQEGSTGIEPVIDTRFLHAASSSRRESDLPNSRWNAKVCLSLLWQPFCYYGNNWYLPHIKPMWNFLHILSIYSALVKAVGYLGNRCQHYYYRCVARMSALNVHMASPSKVGATIMASLSQPKGTETHTSQSK